jgi:hypothetical protein
MRTPVHSTRERERETETYSLNILPAYAHVVLRDRDFFVGFALLTKANVFLDRHDAGFRVILPERRDNMSGSS